MRRMRLALLAVTAAVVAAVWAGEAWAPHPVTSTPPLILRFRLGPITATSSTTTPLPVGSRIAITAVLSNRGRQFKKPSGAVVGRMLIECTVLVATPDGICAGIAHLPDGFFTFAGSGPFTRSTVKHWAITGGIGPYDGTGEMTVTSSSKGSFALVLASQ